MKTWDASRLVYMTLLVTLNWQADVAAQRTFCSLNATQCQHGSCVRHQCDCYQGYGGRSCNILLTSTTRTGAHRTTKRKRRRSTVSIQVLNTNSPFGPCASDPCLNDGQCTEIGNQYSCACPPGYDPVFRCHSCQRGFYGEECSQSCGMCEPSRCNAITGCEECLYPWMGQHCNQIDCTLDNLESCSPGKCDTRSNTCHCPAGWRGFNCNQKYRINRLKRCQRKCHGGGTCVVQGGREVCACPKGHYPEEDLVNGVEEGFCVEKCVPNSITCLEGVCRGIRGFNHEKTECYCYPGYRGTYCDKKCGIDRWAPQCAGECGKCFKLPCHALDGDCGAEGCLPGYKNALCDEEDDDFQGEREAYARTKLSWIGRYLEAFEIEETAERLSLQNTTSTLIFLACRRLRRTCTEEIIQVLPGSVQVEVLVSFKASAVEDLTLKDDFTSAVRQVAPQVPPPIQGYEFASVAVTNVYVPQPQRTQNSNKTEDWVVKGFAIAAGCALIVAASIALACTIARKKKRLRKSNMYILSVSRGRTRRVMKPRNNNMAY